MGNFKEAGFPAFLGAGEGPLFIAEELAFQKLLGKGGAVDGNEGIWG